MNYVLRSIITWSFWRYSLFSKGAIISIFSITGAIYLGIEMLDFFNMYTKDKYSKYSIFIIFLASIIITIFTRRPVSRISYKIPKKDFSYEVIIGDLLDTKCTNVVISTNTTFDTDIASGLIAPDSLQGQLAFHYFNSNTAEMDRQIDESLKNMEGQDHPAGKGKKKRYPIGTIAKLQAHGKTFFFIAMSELNPEGNARSSVKMVDEAIEALWTYIAERGELADVAMPIMGTGRGRIQLSRTKMVERIAQSFADASAERIFSNRLAIYIHPNDATKHAVNLFEIRDYLAMSLHI
jgi:low affinity Fe/Cu permease